MTGAQKGEGEDEDEGEGKNDGPGLQARVSSTPPWRPALLTVVITVMVMLAALLVQHRRHGWPFSLHHGVTAGGALVRAPDPGPAPSSGRQANANAHPRAPVTVDASRATTIGIRTEKVRREVVARPIRAVATVVPDESRVSHVHTRVAGWIEKLHVTTTGARVRRGQPLAEIFSQELLASQTELLAARQAADGTRSAVWEGARSRLQVLGLSLADIEAVERRGQAKRTVTVTAPGGGVVIHRGIAVGTAVDPSTEILTIADLSRVWAIAEISEADIPGVHVGSMARLTFPASGRDPFEAKITFLSPTLSERTRTLRARFEVENRGGRLRPGIFGSAEIGSDARQALTVPRDAVVDTGLERLVFVEAAPGHWVPTAVELGVRMGDRVEVRRGLQEGQAVVSAGVFLVDSESRLRATGGAGTGHNHGSGSKETQPTKATGSGDAAASAAVPAALSPARTGHEGH